MMNIKFPGLLAKLSHDSGKSMPALSQSRTSAHVSAHLSPGPQKSAFKLLAWASAGAPARPSLNAKLCLTYWIPTDPM